MAKTNNKFKTFWRYVWEFFKSSILPSVMYFCAGLILMMIVMRKEKLAWTGKELLWTIVCTLGAAAYQGLTAWANGGNQYEMLVSGNIKRMTYNSGNEYKMSTHKEVKEYRPWKGFVIGAFVALYCIAFGIMFACNQAEIHSGSPSKGVGIMVLLGFVLSGWSLIPFYCMNSAGMSVSYLFSLFFVLVPIAVSGGLYIAGAYSRRNKALKAQELAEQKAREEAERKSNKKINYGGLPGTKPKKKK